MAAPTIEHPLLSDEQFQEIVPLIADADSVELKLTVPQAEHRATARSLGLDPLEAQIRQVFFFDTPDLQLNKHGVVVRARRVQAKGDDSVVKLRPVVPSELPKRLRRDPNFGVEVDAMPGGFVCSGSFKNALSPKAVKAVVAGERPVRKLFSKQQREFFEINAPEGIALEDLTLLGPIFVLKLKYAPEGFDRRLVTELWLYPDGTHILELSTKCAPHEAFDVAAASRGFLTDKGVNLSGAQQTKTRSALEFLTRQLDEQ